MIGPYVTYRGESSGVCLFFSMQHSTHKKEVTKKVVEEEHKEVSTRAYLWLWNHGKCDPEKCTLTAWLFCPSFDRRYLWQHLLAYVCRSCLIVRCWVRAREIYLGGASCLGAAPSCSTDKHDPTVNVGLDQVRGGDLDCYVISYFLYILGIASAFQPPAITGAASVWVAVYYVHVTPP